MVAATFLALGAAVLHATWNLVLKRSRDSDAAFWAIVGLGALGSIPVLLAVGPPGMRALPYLAASAMVQVLYVTGLARAYTHGDFSLAYPLARGSGALLAAVGGALILSDHLPGPAWLGVAVVAASLVLLTRRGATALSLGWAIATGLAIAVYSVIDTAGSRHAVSGISYGLSLQVATGVTVSAVGLARRRTAAMLAEIRRTPFALVAAGVLITASYTMVVSAFRLAPVGYVSVLRESSVLIGALLGWLVLRERFGRHRVLSAAVMVAGLALLVATG
jgi:drug/metabolite transporter (DMT)-like permease